MYVNAFLNMTNIFLTPKNSLPRHMYSKNLKKLDHQKKSLISNLLSESINMLIYAQKISNPAWVWGGMIGYSSVWHACSARFESSSKHNFFVKGWLQITKYIYIYICILSVYKCKEKQKLWWILLNILFSILMENNI